MSDQLDNAAAAALFMLGITHPTNIENMGALYSDNGGYSRTETVSTGQGAHVKGSLSIPAGSLAGLFHNHPGPQQSIESFSPDDLAMARRMGVPSYISTPSGNVLRFDPKSNTTQPVLAEFPIEELVRHIEARRAKPLVQALAND